VGLFWPAKYSRLFFSVEIELQIEALHKSAAMSAARLDRRDFETAYSDAKEPVARMSWVARHAP
jgi:hypothetical protein